MSGPTLELAMIVRNGESCLARCLNSSLPAVSGILVGDTGSTDASRDIAQGMGARVLEIPWENDFAKARNAVLQECRADWVLWLDADEMLDPAGAAWIPALLEQNQKAKVPVDAWEVWRWNYVRTLNSRSGELVAEPNPVRLEESRPYPAYTRHLNTLLFRRLPGLYFENCVHETVSGRVRALGLHAAEAPFVIHHFGAVEDSEQVGKDKRELYYQLGRQKVLDNPEDDWAHYELGLSELEHHHDAAAALTCFERALALNPAREGAWIYAGICLTRLGRLREALDCLRHAEQMDVYSGLLQAALGDVFFQAGDARQAVRCYRLAAECAAASPLLQCKLGACEVCLGEFAAGLERIEAGVAREPEAGELYEIWAAAAFQAGDTVTAANVAAQRLSLGKPPASSFIVAATIEAHQGHWDKALVLLRDGQQRYPADPMLEREAQAVQQRISVGESAAAISNQTAEPACLAEIPTVAESQP
ncbi:MAG: glycosyltransferase [Terracidiphilus sp.]|nr:glycosyltransferase [Terracidiphilus sp.]